MMRQRMGRQLAVGSLVLGLTGAAFGETNANDVQAQMESLKAQVAQLSAANKEMQSQVGQLSTKNDETWLNQKRAEEVKSLIKEVLSDADTRASLLESGATAGHNGTNFFLASEDGNFLLKVWGQIQARYIANFRNKVDNHENGDGDLVKTTIDPSEDGFQIRRAKVGFEGFIGDPKLEYRILFAPNRDTGAVEIEDAWIAYTVMDGVKVWGGRYQDRFSREAYMSSKNQQTVDRSTVAYAFAGNDGFVEGVGVEWKVLPDWLTLSANVNDGLNSGTQGGASTGFQNGGNDFNNDATDIAVTARADAKLTGDWKNMSDVEAWSSVEDLQIFLGGAVHYELGESGDRNAASNFKVTSPGLGALTIPYDDFTQFTVDGIVKIQGFSLMAAGYAWFIETPEAAPTGKGTVEAYAATIQAGYFVIPDKLEPFVRYEYIMVDNALDTNDLSIVTGGFNYFFKKHAAKLTVDAVWAINNVNSANTFGTSLSGVGLLTDDLHQENQVVVRAQFQLLF